MSRQIPLHTVDGVAGAQVSTHPFRTDDGLDESLLRFCREPAGDPGALGLGVAGGNDSVLVIPGLTTSSDMFIMPEHRNLVGFLLDNGFTDVWTLDGRMSNRLDYNSGSHRFTLDDVALFDYPPALEVIRAATGGRRLHVISHCLGAVTFLMSLFGGVIDGIGSVIANSAGLTPRVPRWSQLKLAAAPDLLERVLRLPGIGPDWADAPWTSRRGLIARAVGFGHWECDQPACNMLSLMWGSGHPALYRHDNLHEATHRRSGDLYGPTGFHYYRHMHKMVRAGRAIKFDTRNERHSALPDDYLAGAAEIDTPVLLTTGANNRVFTGSNVVCYQRLEAVAPGLHELEVFEGYGHQDIFMGWRSDRDVFPRMLDFLKRQAG